MKIAFHVEVTAIRLVGMFNRRLNYGTIMLILFSAFLPNRPVLIAQAKHRVTLDDLLSLRDVDEVELSPTGNKIAYISEGTLNLCAIEDPEHPKSLGSATVPIWSPDAQKLAYYSDKSGTTQLWVYDLATQRSKAITKVAGGIAPDRAAGSLWGNDNWRYSWSPNSTQIVFASELSSPSYVSAANTNELKKAGQPLVLDDKTPIEWTLSGIFVSAFGQPIVSPGTQAQVKPPLTSQLFVVDVASGTTRQITHDGRGYFTPDWSPDGRMIVCSTPDGKNMFGFPLNATSILLLTLQTGETVSLTNAVGNKSMPSWAPDGKKIAFFTGEHGGLRSVEVLAVGNGKLQDLSRQLSVGVGVFCWSPQSNSILAIAMAGVDFRPIRINLERGDVHSLAVADAAKRWKLSVARDGTVAWPESDRTHHGVIRLLRYHSAHSELLVDLNPQIKNWELGEQEVVHWKGARGKAMEGILIKPVGYQQGKRYPLIVDGYPGIRNNFMFYPMEGDLPPKSAH